MTEIEERAKLKVLVTAACMTRKQLTGVTLGKASEDRALQDEVMKEYGVPENLYLYILGAHDEYEDWDVNKKHKSEEREHEEPKEADMSGIEAGGDGKEEERKKKRGLPRGSGTALNVKLGELQQAQQRTDKMARTSLKIGLMNDEKAPEGITVIKKKETHIARFHENMDKLFSAVASSPELGHATKSGGAAFLAARTPAQLGTLKEKVVKQIKDDKFVDNVRVLTIGKNAKKALDDMGLQICK